MCARHTNGLACVKGTEEKISERAACTRDRCESSANELCRKVAIEVKDAARIGVGAGLNSAQVGNVGAEFDLMVTVLPVEAVLNLVDVIEISNKAIRRSETRKATSERDRRNAVDIGCACYTELILDAIDLDALRIDRITDATDTKNIDLVRSER
jgi:hypothetical protein